MPSPKKASKSAAVSIPRSTDYSRAFLKDWTSLVHSGRYDMTRLKEVMLLLIENSGPLGPEWKDHELTGGGPLGGRRGKPKERLTPQEKARK